MEPSFAQQEAKKDMNTELTDPELLDQWESVAEPAHQLSQATFEQFARKRQTSRSVLNCAIPMARAKALRTSNTRQVGI
jgi:hypothetical protein